MQYQCNSSRCCVINGYLDLDERPANQSQFAEDTQVLFSPQTGGESLNLQFGYIAVSYNVPWNP